MSTADTPRDDRFNCELPRLVWTRQELSFMLRLPKTVYGVHAPALPFGEGRWRIEEREADGNWVVRKVFDTVFHGPGAEILIDPPSHPASAWRAVLERWEVTPEDIRGRAASDLAPFLASSADQVRLRAIELLALCASSPMA